MVGKSKGRYQVMTLSAIGDAETPAGGSVCIRYHFISNNDSILRRIYLPFLVPNVIRVLIVISLP